MADLGLMAISTDCTHHITSQVVEGLEADYGTNHTNGGTLMLILTVSKTPGAGFTKGLRLRLSQGLKSESFVFAKSWT